MMLAAWICWGLAGLALAAVLVRNVWELVRLCVYLQDWYGLAVLGGALLALLGTGLWMLAL